MDDKGEDLKIENYKKYTPQGFLKFSIKPFHHHNSLFGNVFGKQELSHIAEGAKTARKTSKLSIPTVATRKTSKLALTTAGDAKSLGIWHNYWVSMTLQATPVEGMIFK